MNLSVFIHRGHSPPLGHLLVDPEMAVEADPGPANVGPLWGGEGGGGWWWWSLSQSFFAVLSLCLCDMAKFHVFIKSKMRVNK